jgi:hypothetical protein
MCLAAFRSTGFGHKKIRSESAKETRTFTRSDQVFCSQVLLTAGSVADEALSVFAQPTL